MSHGRRGRKWRSHWLRRYPWPFFRVVFLQRIWPVGNVESSESVGEELVNDLLNVKIVEDGLATWPTPSLVLVQISVCEFFTAWTQVLVVRIVAKIVPG